MDPHELFRRPLTDPKRNDPGEVTVTPSPDGRYKMAFSHFAEVSMMSFRGLFNLLDAEDHIIDRFEPLITYEPLVQGWNESSTVFVLGIADFGFGYLLIRFPKREVAFLKVPDPFPIHLRMDERSIVLSYDDYSLSLQNSTGVVGGETLEIPSKIWLKPPDRTILLENVRFFPRSDLLNLQALTATDEVYRLEPIGAGFRPFHGRLPNTTMDRFNGQHLEIYQLEAFAENGDRQSQAWLEAIKEKTKGKYSKWDSVSSYLGYRKRKILR